MKLPNFNQAFLTVIISSTVIVLAGLTLDFTGVISLGCNADGCNVRLERVSDKP